MEVKVEELKPNTAYYASGGPSYNKVELIRRLAPEIDRDGKVGPERIQLAVFAIPHKPADMIVVHPAQFRFFDRESESCQFAAMIAYAMYNSLVRQLANLTALDRPIITPDGIGPAPGRLILPPNTGNG